MTSDGDGRPPPAPPSGAADGGATLSGAAPSAPATTGAPILDQPFDADSLYALRAAVAAHVTQAGLAPGRADDLVIAAHELAANAVRHGAGHGRIRIWKSDQALLCEISDNGVPQAPDTPTATTAGKTTATTADATADATAGNQGAAQWRTEPGHGLSLVRQVADQTSLTSGPDGTLATITFALSVPGPPFGLDQRHLDHCTVLTVTGPLDLSSARKLTAAISGLLAQRRNLVLDLSALSGWDSAGLAALISAQQQMNEPARMVLAAVPGHLAKHLHEAGLASRFTLADSLHAAIAALS